MKISPYGLMALAILGISAPTLVLAETEHEGNDEKAINSTNLNLVLFVTIAAIASVVGYSTWKVYKIRRRAASKTLV